MTTKSTTFGTENLQKPTIAEAFAAHHKKHPDMYDGLVKLARQAKARGKTQVGIKMLCEVVRWEKYINSDEPKEMKFSNNFTAHYARKIMKEESDLAGMFKLSSQREKKV